VYSVTSTGDVDAVVRDAMSWLSRPDNTDWKGKSHSTAVRKHLY